MIKRSILLVVTFLILWQLIILAFRLPPYLLPSPIAVFHTWFKQSSLIATQTWPTFVETLLGLLLGAFFGAMAALSMVFFQPVRFWMLPLLVISQAIPIFAIAPLLVIWFGYGMVSKIVTTILILFFPVTTAFYDGLRRTESGWLDLAKTMKGKRWNILWFVRVPAALPALASGLRVATAAAPLGAVIGEWVGSSRGLGFLLLNANARLETDLMFAALFTLVIMSLLLYFIVDVSLRHLIFWQIEK